MAAAVPGARLLLGRADRLDSQTGSLALPPLLLYVGCILWTIGYDTIYALQDIEDDALIGVKSTARLFGRRARLLVGLFYAATVVLWGAAALLVGAGRLFLVGMPVVAAMLGWQVLTLRCRANPASALVRFRANHWVGLALTLALLLEWRDCRRRGRSPAAGSARLVLLEVARRSGRSNVHGIVAGCAV